MDKHKKYQLILASQSPRRKELLGHLQIPFQIVVSDIEEIMTQTDPVLVAEDLALQKGEDVFNNKGIDQDSSLVIAADTIVCYKETLYGKPANREDAARMLLELAGKTHQVVTGLALLKMLDGKLCKKTFHVSSLVTFDMIDSELLERYLSTNESLDKAGAYGIQGPALSFISSLDGSYSNVVGFPLSRLRKELIDFVNEGHGERCSLWERFA